MIEQFVVLQEIFIEKNSGEKLGMIIKGGLQGQPGNPTDANDEGVFISKVNEGSVAERTANLHVGQRIIEVNGQSLLGATHQEAVSALRSAGDSIHLLLCHGFDDPEAKPKALMSPSSSSEESSRSPTSSVVAVEKQETESVKEAEEQQPNLVPDKVSLTFDLCLAGMRMQPRDFVILG